MKIDALIARKRRDAAFNRAYLAEGIRLQAALRRLHADKAMRPQSLKRGARSDRHL